MKKINKICFRLSHIPKLFDIELLNIKDYNFYILILLLILKILNYFNN